MNVVNGIEDLAMDENLIRGIVAGVVCERWTGAGEGTVVQDSEGSEDRDEACRKLRPRREASDIDGFG